MLNREMFREFNTDEEVNEWAMNYFGSWIKDMQLHIDNNNGNNIAKLLYDYTGNKNVLYNNFLRGHGEFEAEQVEQYSKDIEIISDEISKFELQENILVYRYTHKILFRQLFEHLEPKTGKTFTDKGFMSTTLIAEHLKEFAKSHHYNCILKLYLPKGTKGAYIGLGISSLNEQEFLLPPNAMFKLVSKHPNFKYRMMVYECELVRQ